MARPLIARLGDAAERAVEAARATVLPIHPLQIDVLKLIACICMLIDHINTCLFDRASVWAWLIGRLAFPLFGLTFVLTLKAHKAMATAKRLFIWAICTQPVYALAFANTGFSPWWAGNILFSFAATAYLVALSQAPSAANIAKGLVVFVVVSITQAPSSFGMAGIVLMLGIWFLLKGRAPRSYAAIAGVAFANLNPAAPTLAACLTASLALILIVSTCLRSREPRRWLPPHITLWFYAGHFWTLCVVPSILLAT
jgi:hypothetical protein